MWNNLSSIRAAVDRKPVATVGNVLFFRHLPGDQKHFSGQGTVRFLKVINGSDMLPGDDDIVDGGLRVNVTKCNEIIVAIH